MTPRTTQRAGQHRIAMMEDLVAVATDDNIDTLAADVGEWLRWHLAVRKASGVTMDADVFLWNDDGEAGIGHVQIRRGRRPHPMNQPPRASGTERDDVADTLRDAIRDGSLYNVIDENLASFDALLGTIEQQQARIEEAETERDQAVQNKDATLNQFRERLDRQRDELAQLNKKCSAYKNDRDRYKAALQDIAENGGQDPYSAGEARIARTALNQNPPNSRSAEAP